MPDFEDGPVVSLVLGTSTGGVGVHVAALAAGLIADGWSVRVCGPAATDGLFGFSRLGADFRPVAISGGPRDLVAVRKLRLAVRGSSIVHAHGIRAGAVAALTGVRPLVVTWHNAVLETARLRRFVAQMVEQLVARRATVSLAASADLAAQVRVLGGRDVRDGPIGVVASPTSHDQEAKRAAIRAEFRLTAGQHLVLSVSRLHPQKGLDTLVRAAARWPNSQVLVVIAGDGPLSASLAGLINELQAPVRLLGRRSDISDLLAAADLVVLPSRWEARSLAAQEALLAGRPLLATAVGGLPALLGSGAMLIAPDDIDALDAAVNSLLADPGARLDLATRGRAQALTWPTATDTLTQVEALYAELRGRRNQA